MKIYLGNLAAECTESDLRELCEPFGRIDEIDLKVHHRSEDPLRFALVSFENANAGEQAIEALDQTVFQGRPIRVLKAFTRPNLPEIPENGPDSD